MAKKKPLWPFILIGVVLLITAGTIYVNRVILPVQIKNIVITQAKSYLKRNVEIGNLHFNWVKGLILNDIKIYQKDSSDIFFQSPKISLGIIFIPGFKRHQLTIPFCDILNPQVHLIRDSNKEWNFNDLLTPLDAKPSPVKVNLLGINLIDGKISVDDKSNAPAFHQALDDVHLKVGLSVNGINFDTRAVLKSNNGLFNILGTYQPLSKSLDAHVYVKNIRPNLYVSLLPMPVDINLVDGALSEVNIDTHVDEKLFSIKGDIRANDMNIKYGQMAFTGNVEANINQCDIKQGSINIDASVLARNAVAVLSPEQNFKGTLSLEKVKIRQDKDGTQLVGTINGQNLSVGFNGLTLRGDIFARPLTIEMKNENDINLKGDIKSNHLEITLNEHQDFSGNVAITDAQIQVSNKKDFTFKGKVDLDEVDMKPVENIHATGSINLKRLGLALNNDTLHIQASGELNNWQMNLDKDKSIVTETSFSVDATYPLLKPNALTYSGTFNVDHADVTGYPFGPYNAITAKGDFKTDLLSVKLFTLVAFDSTIKGAASVLNFKDPVLSVEMASESIDLAKAKNVIPDIYTQYGLETKGMASFNASFEGLLSSPLSGKINIKAQLQGVDVKSSKFNQSIDNITGTVSGAPDSLTWNNFSGTYLSKAYTLTGSLNNFKSPKIKTSLNGDDIKLETVVENTGKSWNITKLTGQYFDFAFDATGQVNLPENQPPLIDLQTNVQFNVEKAIKLLPTEQQKTLEPLQLKGAISIDGHIGGNVNDWKNLSSNATIKSPLLNIMGYSLNDINITLNQHDGKISNSIADASAYNGKIHSVINFDLNDATMPFDIALNIDALDLAQFKKDVPSLEGKDIKGKFYLTAVGKGKAVEAKAMTAKGSLAIREGFLTEFKMFEGLLGVLNEALRLGQLMITDVEGNFVVENQKINTDNLHLISPSIVLLTQGWVDLNQMCDLNVSVDMTSGIIPPVAEEVLRTLSIHIYDKITAPKFKKKISVPQVLNSIIKTIGIFQ